jgi:O-antigen/teichoic acid export membrane protein
VPRDADILPMRSPRVNPPTGEEPPAQVPPQRGPSLTQTVIRGAGLAGLGFALSQALNFAIYLVLVRLLTPRDFGLYAAGTLITGIGGLFAESGMMAALITREGEIEAAASTAFVSLGITGIGLTLASVAISPLLGLAFHDPHVTLVAVVISGWLLVRALTIVPDALPQRRFSFARRVVVDPLGVVAYAAAAVPLAVAGAGVWAMVAGAYASILVEAVFAWIAASFRPRLRDASVDMWRELASFARPLVIGEVLRRATAQVDVLVLGRASGTATLGQYRNGMMLAQQPGNAFSSIGSYVILPAFARLARSTTRLADAADRGFRLTFAVVLPAGAACLPLGVPVAVILMGERWRVAGHAIAGLCGFVLGGSLLSISGELMKALRALRLQLVIHVIWFLLVATTVTAGAVLAGAVGVAVAMSLSTLSTAVFTIIRIAPLLSRRPTDLLSGSLAPAAASAVMVGVILLFDSAVHLLNHGEAVEVLLLAADLAAATATYGGSLIVLDSRFRATVLAFIRRRRLGG